MKAANRSNTRRILFNGENKPLSTWAREIGMSWEGLAYRIDKLKWSPEKALTVPSKKGFYLYV
jgi:hypothetical protein